MSKPAFSAFGRILMELTLVSVMLGTASASSTLKKIQTRPDGQIEMEFDSPVEPAQIKAEFFRDVVQLSLNDTTIYPAKIVGADTEHVTKIFAYQYTPKLVRARFTVRNGKGESYQNAFQYRANGKIVLVQFNQPPKAAPVVAAAALAPVAPIVEKAPEKPVEKKIEKPVQASARKASTQSLTTGESAIKIPSSLKWMFVLITLFGVAFFSLTWMLSKKKKTQRRTDAADNRLVAWTKRILGNKLGSPEHLIEVVSTQAIGPKKSIVMVRVREKVLVLAVSENSMSLLSELDGEEVYDDFEVKPAPRPLAVEPPIQQPIQRAALERPIEPSPVDIALKASTSARQGIRERLQGLKEL